MISRPTAALKVSLIILFVACLFDWEYGFYQLVRFLGMFGFIILGITSFLKSKIWFAVWIISAILINPFFKVALGRFIWNVVDVFWALLLTISLILENNIDYEED